MSYRKQLNDLSDAKFLWSVYRRLREQIKDEKIEENKIYEVKIEGKIILGILSKAQKKFRDSRQIRKVLQL